jgi:hypothetical protein
VGGFDLRLLGLEEPTVRYHPDGSVNLTYFRNPEEGQWKTGSLTGAVASQIVTEAREARFRLFGNQPTSAKA